MAAQTEDAGTEKVRIGLFGVAEDMRQAGRQLTVHSGQGVLQITEEIETQSRRSTLFPGTLAYASIPA